MAEFERTTYIEAPPERVWATLDDIATIERWNPGVRASELLGEQASGAGASRVCDLGGRNYVHEEVVEHEPGRALTMRVTETNLPLRDTEIRFRVQPEGEGTRVTVSPQYQVRFGLLGSALDATIVRRTYSRGMAALLAGLKEYVEEGKAVA